MESTGRNEEVKERRDGPAEKRGIHFLQVGTF